MNDSGKREKTCRRQAFCKRNDLCVGTDFQDFAHELDALSHAFQFLLASFFEAVSAQRQLDFKVNGIKFFRRFSAQDLHDFHNIDVTVANGTAQGVGPVRISKDFVVAEVDAVAVRRHFLYAFSNAFAEDERVDRVAAGSDLGMVEFFTIQTTSSAKRSQWFSMAILRPYFSMVGMFFWNSITTRLICSMASGDMHACVKGRE